MHRVLISSYFIFYKHRVVICRWSWLHSLILFHTLKKYQIFKAVISDCRIKLLAGESAPFHTWHCSASILLCPKFFMDFPPSRGYVAPASSCTWLCWRLLFLYVACASVVELLIFMFVFYFYVHVFKPPPPIGTGGGYMFSGHPSVPLSVRVFVRPWFTW